MTSVGEFKVSRLVPNRYTNAVGPFIFLDHLVPTMFDAKEPHAPDGSHAHPHRGIATFTYFFKGEMEHFDSQGNHGIVGSGGAQWMKAGNGIVHDENPSQAFQASGGELHGTQFWINLPSSAKAERPAYMGVASEEFPKALLPDDAGFLKVLIGDYEGATSPIKTFSKQFNYHLQLNPGASFSLSVDPTFESAALIPTAELEVNGSRHANGEVIVFGIEGTEIAVTNHGDVLADILIFGGESYTESIVAHGPFVMNSESEIAQAYRDFYAGKYGTISYAESLVA